MEDPNTKPPVGEPSENLSTMDALIEEYNRSNENKSTETDEGVEPEPHKVSDLYLEDSGPKIHVMKSALITPPFLPKKLPELFKSLPVFGQPSHKSELNEYQKSKIKEFVGFNLNDEEFDKLYKYCSPQHLKTGKELIFSSTNPSQGLSLYEIEKQCEEVAERAKGAGQNLCIRQKHMAIKMKDSNFYIKKLKYRGVKLMLLNEPKDQQESPDEEKLQAGKDILVRVRVYRPFHSARDKICRGRPGVLSCDIVLTGRHKLTALRDRIVCPNDVSMRLDVSNNPDELPATSAKELFPSGFLFINNVFYVDTREGCVDYSAPLREWAERRNLGTFPFKDMSQVVIEDVVLKLGHPEVYVHQGNCEHVFLFSEIRLLTASDPLTYSFYPTHTSYSQNQTVYCTTCAEFGAKWIVVGSARVPFDPAFFCDTCLKLYMYKDGKKIGDFKAYAYRGNEINVLKPTG